MTDRHMIYAGRFIHNGQFAEFDLDPATRLAFPRIRQPVTTNELDRSLNEMGISREQIAEWGIRFDKGFLKMDQHNVFEAIEFVVHLAHELDLDIVDKTLRVMPIEELGG